MLSPWILGFCFFTAGPMALSFYYSFTHFDLISTPQWIGLDNYRFMFGIGESEDPYFGHAVRNTLYIIAFGVPMRIVFGVATAMLLTRPGRGRNVYRTLFFMPSLAPRVGATLVFVYLLNPGNGPVNVLLEKIPFVTAPLWFLDPEWSKPALIFLGLWGIGDAIVLYLAGLLDIPRHLYEAIAIEGAGRWQRFRYVTLPMLTPVIFFTLIIGIIDGFQYFDQAYIASGASGTNAALGSPQNSLLFYGIYMYDQAFRQFHMGYAAAMAWVLFVAIMATTAFLLVTSKRWVHSGGALS